MRMYPVFTDGEQLAHSDDPVCYKGKWKFAYFTEFGLKDWKIKEEPLLKGKAKDSFDRWRKE